MVFFLKIFVYILFSAGSLLTVFNVYKIVPQCGIFSAVIIDVTEYFLYFTPKDSFTYFYVLDKHLVLCRFIICVMLFSPFIFYLFDRKFLKNKGNTYQISFFSLFFFVILVFVFLFYYYFPLLQGYQRYIISFLLNISKNKFIFRILFFFGFLFYFMQLQKRRCLLYIFCFYFLLIFIYFFSAFFIYFNPIFSVFKYSFLSVAENMEYLNIPFCAFPEVYFDKYKYVVFFYPEFPHELLVSWIEDSCSTVIQNISTPHLSSKSLAVYDTKKYLWNQLLHQYVELANNTIEMLIKHVQENQHLYYRPL